MSLPSSSAAPNTNTNTQRDAGASSVGGTASRPAGALPEALGDATGLELAELIRRRALSSEEVTRFYLDRIAQRNDTLSAFVQVLADEALRAARAHDKPGRAHDDARTPFRGVPIGIKDLNFVRGAFTRMGSEAFQNFFSVFDCRTTQKLRAAGFVILGKTATSEMGALPVTEPDIHAPTRNPWDLAVTAGGSSGGAGAAVAGGLLPLAHGSDGGGSVRIPAALCHLFGFKPSRGRIENAYGLPDRHILYTDGALTRSVDDAAAMLDVMAGLTSGRPHWAPPPLRSFLELSRRPVPRLRVRVATRSTLGPVEPAIEQAVLQVARVLEAMGHHVEEGTPLEGSVEEFLPAWQFTAAQAPIPDWQKTQAVTRWLAEEGKLVDESTVLALFAKLTARAAAWMGDADIALTPTIGAETPAIGAAKALGLSPRGTFDHYAPLGFFTAAFNVSGQPAASFPVGLSPKGHPMGVQIIGKPLADAEVLAVCQALEAAIPFRDIRPPFPFETHS
jgi:amidase